MTNIYVGNLDWQTTEDDLRAAFEAYGAVSSVSIIKDKQTGQSRGFAFVEMDSVSEAQAAMNALNEKELNGRTITVNPAKPREERSGGGQRSGGFNRGDRSDFGRNRRR
jgi:RNA recognition motif-containing protein